MRPAVRTAALLAAASLVVAGCSGGSDYTYTRWTDAQQVIAAVDDAGFDCSFDSSRGVKQVLTENPSTRQSLGGTLILCEGFQVLLHGDDEGYRAGLREGCSSVTADALAAPSLRSTVVVVGDTFVISGTGEKQGYPDDAPPDELATAFDARALTLFDYYGDLCDGIPAAPAPSPSASLPTLGTP